MMRLIKSSTVRGALSGLILFELLISSAEAAISKERLVSGGEPASCTSSTVSWAAVGEGIGGCMSGGGFTVYGGGGSGGADHAAPFLTALSPADGSCFYQGNLVSLSVTAANPEPGSLKIRYLVDGVAIGDWANSATLRWDTGATPFGWHTLRVEVKNAFYTVAREIRIFIFWKPPI